MPAVGLVAPVLRAGKGGDEDSAGASHASVSSTEGAQDKVTVVPETDDEEERNPAGVRGAGPLRDDNLERGSLLATECAGDVAVRGSE